MRIQKEKQFNPLPAPIGLRDYLQYYNLVFPERDTFAARYTLMPNACGTLSLAFDGGAVTAELWGAATAPVLLGAEPNRYRVLLLIQLSPCGLYQITRQNQRELAGRRLSLGDLDSGLTQQLNRAFVTSGSAMELAAACNGVLARRMETRVVSDALFLAANVISQNHGQVRVNELARQTCYSQRHLNRLFQTQIGMGVKDYARLTRFQYVLKHLQKRNRFRPSGYLAELSQEAGYFDQAHLDKDFKAISGVSPRHYLQTMSDFYYDGAEIYPTISSKAE